MNPSRGVLVVILGDHYIEVMHRCRGSHITLWKEED